MHDRKEGPGTVALQSAPDEPTRCRSALGDVAQAYLTRGRLGEAGPLAFADPEILDMLLRPVLPSGSIPPVIHALLARFGDAAAAIAAPLPSLLAVDGMEAAGAAALKAVQAIAMRLTRTALNSRPLLGNPERLLAYLTATIGRAEVEQVHVLYLDTRNRLIADEPQGRGTVNHAPIYPREVAKRALELQATALILARNHPSGDPTPSAADRAMTDEIVAAAQVFGIIVHDHIVVGQGRHLSFRRAGLLKRPAVAEPASRAPLPAAAE
jgi:DNA repair protein RadC